jgi:sugar lactone lactonase YvrE
MFRCFIGTPWLCGRSSSVSNNDFYRCSRPYRMRARSFIAGAGSLATALLGHAALAAPINPFPYNANQILLTPYISEISPGGSGEQVTGTVSVKLGIGNQHGSAPITSAFRYALTVDGKTVSPILDRGATYNWDTTTLADGAHALGVVLVDGEGDLRDYRAYGTGVTVKNTNSSAPSGSGSSVSGILPTPPGPTNLLTFGNTISSRLYGATPDQITIDPSTHLPGATAAPLTPVYSAPVSQRTDEFATPFEAHSNRNWFIEPLTQSNTGLYQGDPGIYLTKDGTPIVKNYYPQATDDSTESADEVLRQNTRAGERNDNLVSPYATYTPNPDGPGWYGVDLAGWVYKVDATGKVTTIAGREVKSDVIPLDYQDTSIDQQTLADHQVKWVGDFGHAPGHGHGGSSGSDAVVPCQADTQHLAPPMCNPHDIVVDPRDSKILYVADTDNHVITKIDMNLDPPKLSIYAGTKQTAGDDNGIADTKFNRPTSITMTADGTMYVADHGNNAIKKIGPDGGVTTIKSDLEGPFVVRLDTDGNIVFGENPTSKIKRLNMTDGTVTQLADGTDSRWVWLDVDRKGNVGPVDDILYTTATGGAGNVHMYRVSKNGDRIDEFLPNPSTTGALNQGPANRARDGHGHYPWVLSIDDDEGKILTHGFGNVGLRVVRLRNDDDPTGAEYDHRAYGLGKNIYMSGSAFGFPVDARPSFTALRGESGHNFIGLPTFDELALLPDQDLAEYIRAGFGGAIARPEITCSDMDALIYYIRMNSLLGQSQTIVPGNSCDADILVPELLEISYKWGENGFEITWNTDTETIGYVAHGVSENLHRWSEVEDSFGTEHAVYLDTLPEDGTEIFFTIYSRDKSGNIITSEGESLTIDREVTVASVSAPSAIAIFLMITMLMARSRQLSRQLSRLS